MSMTENEEKLSPILENYLEIIFHEEFAEGAARTGSIAEKAQVSSSTVTSALKTLQKLDYVTYQPYKLIRLTDKGRKLASNLVHKHMVLKEFLHSILQLDVTKADSVACELEHVLDDETFVQLSKLTLVINQHPEIADVLKENMLKKTKVKKKV